MDPVANSPANANKEISSVMPIPQADDQIVLSEERTEYAEDRTVLANERTYTSWIRTGLAALAAGVAIEKFMAGVIPAWNIRIIAVILIVFSAVAFVSGAWRHGHLGIKLRRAGVRAIPTWFLAGASALLVIASVLALVGIWIVVPPTGS
jgi:putative membrane protein